MRNVQEKLLSKLDMPEEGCWNFLGRLVNGYGIISTKEKHYSAHRLAYEMYKGEIPKGMLVCHECDNRQCCNPNHLFLGTHMDNTKDMIAKGRDVFGGYFPTLSDRDILEIKDLIKCGLFSQRTIAKWYNTHQPIISKIKYKE